jgi:hypothetical protein
VNNITNSVTNNTTTNTTTNNSTVTNNTSTTTNNHTTIIKKVTKTIVYRYGTTTVQRIIHLVSGGHGSTSGGQSVASGPAVGPKVSALPNTGGGLFGISTSESQQLLALLALALMGAGIAARLGGRPVVS